MKIDGACHCGCVRYEAEVNLEQVAICHCTDCQIISGSAFRTVVFAAAADSGVAGVGGIPSFQQQPLIPR
jgi:hypothetical protein